MVPLTDLTWLTEQSVPLLWFIIALLTRPTTWSQRATKLLQKKFSNGDGTQ